MSFVVFTKIRGFFFSLLLSLILSFGKFYFLHKGAWIILEYNVEMGFNWWRLRGAGYNKIDREPCPACLPPFSKHQRCIFFPLPSIPMLDAFFGRGWGWVGSNAFSLTTGSTKSQYTRHILLFSWLAKIVEGSWDVRCPESTGHFLDPWKQQRFQAAHYHHGHR